MKWTGNTCLMTLFQMFQMFSDRLAPYLAKLNQTDSRMGQLDAFKLAKTKPACPRAFVDQNVKRPGVGVQ